MLPITIRLICTQERYEPGGMLGSRSHPLTLEYHLFMYYLHPPTHRKTARTLTHASAYRPCGAESIAAHSLAGMRRTVIIVSQETRRMVPPDLAVRKNVASSKMALRSASSKGCSPSSCAHPLAGRRRTSIIVFQETLQADGELDIEPAVIQVVFRETLRSEVGSE